MVRIALQNNWLNRFKIGGGDLEICHLLYVDDAIICHLIYWDGDTSWMVNSQWTKRIKEGNSFIQEDSLRIWKNIWKNMAPSKAKCVTWLVVKKACLTHEVLQKKESVAVARFFYAMRLERQIIIYFCVESLLHNYGICFPILQRSSEQCLST